MAEISRLPIPVMEEWEWQYKGACRDLDPEMFFHPDGERGPRRRNRENAAKAVCATCPCGGAELLGTPGAIEGIPTQRYSQNGG